MMRSVENKIANTILEFPIGEIEIDDVVYPIAPPSLATLILVSSIVSEIPKVDGETDDITSEVLRVAKDFKIIGDIAAVVILGAERVKEKHIVRVKRFETKRTFSVFKMRKVLKRVERIEEKEERVALAEKISDKCSSSLINKMIVKRLENMEISDFFGLITSLRDVNLLKPTREVI